MAEVGRRGAHARWVKSEVRGLRAELEAIATPERAEKERAYLKSELEHLGVNQPGIRAIAVAYHERCRDSLSAEKLRALLDGLWRSEVHELRSLAIALAERWRRTLVPADLDMFERWLRDSRTWAHVDWLATKVVGAITNVDLDANAELGARLDRWSTDKDFWLRRASMLALLDPMRKVDGGDFPRFARYAASMLDEREFFIRKAIGWVLRDVGRKRPALTREFVEAHLQALSRLSLREAIKALPEAEAKALLARHEGRARG